MMIEKNCRMVGVTVTPFAHDCVPDYEEIYVQTKKLSGTLADGILPCASTGEFVRIEPQDRIQVLETVATANHGQKVLIAGACDSSVSGVLHTMEAAKRLQYDACVVCPPYYYGLSQQEVLDFYKNICEAAEGMPVIGYHVPFFTTGIEIPTFCRLLELKGFAGIKDSSANMKRIAHLCDIAVAERPEFLLFTGTDDCLLPALCAGCTGSMTALGATMPKQLAAIYDAFDRGDIETAMEQQQKILPILRLADAVQFPLGYKMLAKATGLHTAEHFPQEDELYPQMCDLLSAW